MKLRTPISLLAGTLVFASQFISSFTAAADWSVDFTKSPYNLNETVVGKEGWVGTIDSGNNSDASIVLAPDLSGENALRLISSGEGELTRRRTFLSNQFEKVEGEKVQLKMSLAYERALPPVTPTSRYMAFTLHQEEHLSPLSIYYSMNDGIFLNGQYAGFEAADLQILAADKVKAGAFYEFDIVLDYSVKKFDITVTGLDIDENPFSWSLEGISFRDGHRNSLTGVDTLRISNFQGERLTMYVRDISVASIPEAGSIAYVLLGTAAGGALVIKRRKA